MAVKINAKVLGIKKPIEVKESNRNLKLAMKLQIKFSETESESDDPMDTIKGLLDVENATTEFISTVLRLDEEQSETLEDLDQDETGELMQEILTKLLHIEDDDEEESDRPVKK